MDDTPWEINFPNLSNNIGEIPMGVTVAISLKILGGKNDVRPALGSRSYDWDFPSLSTTGASIGNLPLDPFSPSGNDQEIIPGESGGGFDSVGGYGGEGIGGGSNNFDDFLQQPQNYTISDGF